MVKVAEEMCEPSQLIKAYNSSGPQEVEPELEDSPYFPKRPNYESVEEIKVSPKKLIKSHKNHIAGGSGTFKQNSSKQRRMLLQAMAGNLAPHQALPDLVTQSFQQQPRHHWSISNPP